MLTIRPDQMAAFTGYLLVAFEKKSQDHLRQRFPQHLAGMTNEALLRLIRIGISKAEYYQVNCRRDVLFFLEYMVCLGVDFDKEQANVSLIRILKIRNLSGTEKMNRMQKIMPLDNLI